MVRWKDISSDSPEGPLTSTASLTLLSRDPATSAHCKPVAGIVCVTVITVLVFDVVDK